jgi:phosphocarrier protein
MHTRPSLEFVRLAARFRSTVILEAKGDKVDGTSLMACSMLDLRVGDSAIVHAIGIDARAAVRALANLIADGFGDAERQSERYARQRSRRSARLPR